MIEMQLKEDILKDNFEKTIISLKNDYEGKAIATLVRRLPSSNSKKAILYIHGFNDYFFQSEMAVKFNNEGYNFYALDLRKYGRSYLSHQKFNDIRNLKSYYEEILKAINIIRRENNEKVILLGHSTGGLILTLFAKDYSGEQMFDGLVLNSPFYEFNQSRLSKKLLPIASFLGSLFPKMKIPGGFSKEYGESIHKSCSGEWDYNLLWKPHVAPKVNLGWIRAVYEGQKELKQHLCIKEPVLILHSTTSSSGKDSKDYISSSDIILNVEDIKKIGAKIEGNVNIVAIEGGIHDLVLSKKAIREKVYSSIFNWLVSNDL